VQPPDGIPVWVVRGGAGDAVGVPLEPASRRRSPKHQRQLDAFVGEVEVGDLVAVPVDGGRELAVGRVTGDVATRGERAVRSVQWAGSLPRAAVTPPALLQDPSVVFRVLVEAAALDGATPPVRRGP
jgi:hypothetical protein